MKSSLKAKLIQHIAAKKGNAGFTLIELLVVIIIIGILSAIALPSFLNQANKARQSEAKTYVGSINRGQQAYFLENNEFGPNIQSIGIGVKEDTENYEYVSAALNDGDFAALTTATAKNEALRGYLGGVQLTEIAGAAPAPGDPVTSDEATTLAVLCEALDAGTTALTAANLDSFGNALQTTEVECGTGVKSIQ